MTKIGIMAGTGLTGLKEVTWQSEHMISTPFGEPSAAIKIGLIDDIEFAFFARHGDPHRLLPHQINYRANLYALKEIGVSHIISVGAVGGIGAEFDAGTLAVPHQLVDYTYGRYQTIFSDTGHGLEHHVDFTEPFSEPIRQVLLESARQLAFPIINHSVVGVVQGPRLETAAEIDKLERDGCDTVNMTLMPEAVLARELGLHYASLALVVNRAAGRVKSEITIDDILKARDAANQSLTQILLKSVKMLNTV